MNYIRKKNIIAIIPARGGSKRIPEKNIKLFCGEPLISYPINMLKSCDFISKVVVSTDSEKIKKVSLLHGAVVPFIRPKKFSNDHSTTADAIIHAVEWLLKNESSNIDYILTVYPAATFITEEHIKNAISILEDDEVNSVFGAIEFPHPIQRAFTIDKKGFVKMVSNKYKSHRTQDIKRTFHDAGQFYLTRLNKLLSEKAVWCKQSKPLLLDNRKFVDVDSIEDFIHAENLFKLYNN